MNIITQIVFEVNHTATYEASFKAKKIMLPSLKCQIFHFLSKFALFTQCLDNKYNFILMQKLRKFTKYILKEMHQRKMDD